MKEVQLFFQALAVADKYKYIIKFYSMRKKKNFS